ncbi:MAG: UvrD-helicase domain-containing protein [Leptospiraceae bacterium]|nr:UvrD-helicase domain-containing protein [Leptospiraceae bacterium]
MIQTILQNLKNGNIFLEASAGTGKTYTIVELVTSLLEKGYGISRFAIITFTEKAAGELQDRIRKGIENKIRNTNHSQKEYFLKQLEDLPFANIGTIHNFCRNLLSQNPDACDFFPFKTEERDVSYRIQKAFDLYLENVESQAIERGEEEKFIQFFLDFDLEKLRTFCIEVIYKMGLQKLKFHALKQEQIQKQFQTLIQEINNKLPNSIFKKYSDSLVSTELFERLQQDKILTKKKELNKNTFRDAKGNSNIEKWNNEFKTINFEIEYLEQQEKLSAFINFVNNWIDFYENYQKKENFLSTDDIILLTEKMLQKHSDVRKTLSEKFDFIIVDECQDTDPRQFSILSMLASSSKNSSNLRLILVGDKKQSIYRFRNADISTVDYYIEKLVPKENILPLDTSYRSRKVLNCFFNEFFSKPTFSNFKYTNVNTGRTDEVALENKPSVILGCFDSNTNKNAETIRLENSELIAGFIKAIYNKEEYSIWDKYESKKRTIRYSDIAILANTNSELKKIQSFLLLQEIPCSTYKEKDYYEENLVAALSFMLHSIENPYDTQSFLFCLDSPLFLIPIQILSKLASEGTLNYFQFVLPDTEEYKELNEIYKLFHEAHSNRYMQSASFLIQNILEKMNTLPRLASGFYGRKNLTLLYQFYDIINELQYEQNMSFGEIAREMRRRVLNKIEGEKRLDYEELDERQDTVKLMTIHASKGLEFPVCILFTAFKTISPATQSNILKFRNSSICGKLNFSFEFKFKLKNEQNLQTLQFQEAKSQDAEEEAKEEARRMYVACTRARDYLFLPLGFPKNISSFSDSLKGLLEPNSNFIQNAIQMNFAECFQSHKEISKSKSSSSGNNSKSIQINPQKQERKLENALKNIKDISKWEFISYSKLHKQDESKEREKLILEKSSDEEISPKEEEVQGDSFWGRQFGLLCHKVLEIFPFEKLSSKKDWKKDLELLCTETYKEFGIDSKYSAYSLETLISLTSSALSYEYTIDQKKAPIPKWKYIQKERKFYSEAGKLGDWILGTWDLLFMFEGKYYILDWKTDQAIGESLETHCLESYKYQIYIYSFVLFQNLLQVSKTPNVKEVYEKKFGGMLFVFLRHLNSGNGVYFVKPRLEEIKKFIETR